MTSTDTVVRKTVPQAEFAAYMTRARQLAALGVYAGDWGAAD